MNELTTLQKVISMICQLICAAILAKASYSKFIDEQMTVTVFTTLGMKETRIIIAIIEGFAAFLLLTNSFSQYGAILGFGVMIGALIAHVSVLGLEVNNDGGAMVMLMVTVIVLTIIIMWIRRRKLPLIGDTFK